MEFSVPCRLRAGSSACEGPSKGTLPSLGAVRVRERGPSVQLFVLSETVMSPAVSAAAL